VCGHQPHGDVLLALRLPSPSLLGSGRSMAAPDGLSSAWVVTCDTSYADLGSPDRRGGATAELRILSPLPAADPAVTSSAGSSPENLTAHLSATRARTLTLETRALLVGSRACGTRFEYCLEAQPFFVGTFVDLPEPDAPAHASSRPSAQVPATVPATVPAKGCLSSSSAAGWHRGSRWWVKAPLPGPTDSAFDQPLFLCTQGPQRGLRESISKIEPLVST
jgi:hypothetical protein